MNYNPEKSKGDDCFLSNNTAETISSSGLLLIKKEKSLPSPKLITKEEFDRKKLWGISTQIDLFECDPEIIRNAEKVKQFVHELCKLIDMKRFGETVVVDFGEDQKVAGFSMTQLIETSLISGHFANQSNSVYIDIFSCKWYNQEKAAEFTRNFFKAKKVEFKALSRGRSIA